MKLTYYGHACFTVTAKGGQLLLTDPPDASVGYPLPPLTPDVITVSHSHYDHSAVSGFDQKALIVNKTESVSAGVFQISCVRSYHDEKQGRQRGENRIYRIDVDGIRVAHLGDLGHLMGRDQLGEIDVLLVPVGGVYTVDPRQAAQLIRELKPRAAIPMHYRTPQSTLQQLAGLEDFLSEWQGPVKAVPHNEFDWDSVDLSGCPSPCVVALKP